MLSSAGNRSEHGPDTRSSHPHRSPPIAFFSFANNTSTRLFDIDVFVNINVYNILFFIFNYLSLYLFHVLMYYVYLNYLSFLFNIIFFKCTNKNNK